MRKTASSYAIAFVSASFLSLCGCSHGPTGDRPQIHRASVGARGLLEYDSSQLLLKSADQVNEILNKRIKKASSVQASQQVDDDRGLGAEPEAVGYLRDAMRIALSRPDQDGFRAAAYARLERELSDLNSTPQAMTQLSDEAIGALQSSDAATNVQATYVILLDNMMAELRPNISNEPWAKTIVENISDARIRLSDAVIRQQLMRTMARPESPSETARRILAAVKK